jgi:type IV pilus assembly protein PilV
MKKIQQGVFLIEALVAILIFSLGILGLVALATVSVAAQSDAQYRTEAANFANEISSQIALNVDRTSAGSIATSLVPFQHQPSGSPDTCSFSGAAAVDASVATWVDKVQNGAARLPGATSAMQQIVIDSGATGFNRVRVTVCWVPPNASAGSPPRHHTLDTYVN